MIDDRIREVEQIIDRLMIESDLRVSYYRMLVIRWLRYQFLLRQVVIQCVGCSASWYRSLSCRNEDRTGRIRIGANWIPPPAEGAPKVALAGPGWAWSGLFWSRGGFASFQSVFSFFIVFFIFNWALGIFGGPNANTKRTP